MALASVVIYLQVIADSSSFEAYEACESCPSLLSRNDEEDNMEGPEGFSETHLHNPSPQAGRSSTSQIEIPQVSDDRTQALMCKSYTHIVNCSLSTFIYTLLPSCLISISTYVQLGVSINGSFLSSRVIFCLSETFIQSFCIYKTTAL